MDRMSRHRPRRSHSLTTELVVAKDHRSSKRMCHACRVTQSQTITSSTEPQRTSRRSSYGVLLGLRERCSSIARCSPNPKLRRFTPNSSSSSIEPRRRLNKLRIHRSRTLPLSPLRTQRRGSASPSAKRQGTRSLWWTPSITPSTRS